METFRNILKNREENGQTNLYSALRNIENEAFNSWLTLLNQKYNSYNGIPHLKNVEKHIDQAVPLETKERFNSKEIYLLLSSVLLHDIGKMYIRDGKVQNHARLSCTTIQKQWPYLKITDEESARKIAILSCSHTWETPTLEQETGDDHDESICTECELLCEKGKTELNLTHDVEYGDLRLTWLAALLRVGDQVDNQGKRAVPGHLRPSSEIEHWRTYISSIQFDRDGECIKLKTNNFVQGIDKWNQVSGGKTNYEHALGELKNINEVLKEWKRPLNEMGLFYKEALIQSAIPKKSLIDCNGQKKIEPPLQKQRVISDIKNAAKCLNFGIIGKEFFSWEALAAESEIRNTKLVKMSAPYISFHEDDGLSFVYSNETWNITGQENNPFASLPDHTIKNVIPTGIEYLDLLLCPENPERSRQNEDNSPWRGGFYFPSVKNGRTIDRVSPVISVHGGSGDGKTSLCTQIATDLIKRNKDPWVVLFYTLEQDFTKLNISIRNYGYLNDKQIKEMVFNCEEPSWGEKCEEHICGGDNGALLFPRLSPILIDPKESIEKDNFERRLSELKKCLKFIGSNTKNGKQIFFILDSITAFSDIALTRNQLFRLFSLFRKNNIPLLFTLERQQKWAQNNAMLSYNIARYLSDIDISLESGNEGGYFRQTIEVTKTRYNRRILGKHQYKLVSHKGTNEAMIDKRRGVVIYPSIHYHLSQKHKINAKDNNYIYTLAEKDHLPVGSYDENGKRSFEANSCFVISGDHGCHKFALAMNLLLNHKPEQLAGNKLIISFSEEKEIILSRVALLEAIGNRWREYLLDSKDDGHTYQGQKIWKQKFTKKDSYSTITAIQFRMGQIMPEEVLLNIRMLFDAELKNGAGLNSVLINDTAHIRNLFPSLAQNNIFLPTLIDMIKQYNMYSVFIDVKRDDFLHKSLMSAADCRFLLTNKENKVTFQVHNIRGKDYDQKTHIIHIDKTEKNMPKLKIESEKESEKSGE